MSTVVKFPDRDRIEEQACDYVARLDAGPIKAEEARQLHAWLEESPLHGQAMLEMSELLDKMSVLTELQKLFPLEATRRRSHTKDFRKTNWPLVKPMAGVAAAGVGLAVVLWAVFFTRIPVDVEQTIFSTAVGEIKTIQLDDGSVVTLNTNSKMGVSYEDSQRRVVLQQGEALFEVVYDALRPFMVEADRSVIEAIGTAFNVHIGKVNVEVTVREGVVEINPLLSYEPAQTLISAMDEPQSKETTGARVSAGGSAFIENTETIIQPVDEETIDNRLAWTRGQLVFEGERLETVIEEVSRYTNKTLVLADNSIRDVPVGGRFKAGDVENLLDILEHGFNIEVTRTSEGKVYLKGRESSEN